MISRAVETIALLLVGVMLGAGGHWVYNKQTQKADIAIDANTGLIALLEEVKVQNAASLAQNKAIAPGILQANKALTQLRGEVSAFKDLDVCIVPDDLAGLLDSQLAAYNKNRVPSKSPVPKN